MNSNSLSPVLTRKARAAATLHARPAAHLVQAIQHFDAELALVHDQVRANAKSILDILALAIQEGDWLVLEAGGADAAAALEILAGLFASGFEE